MNTPYRLPRRGVLGYADKQNPYETVHGDDARDKEAVYSRLQSLGLLDPAPEPSEAPSTLGEAPTLPQVPPKARSTDPWSRQNVRRTLLDLSSAIGSSDNLGQGIGRAAGALGSRMDRLQAEATPIRRPGVGPNGTLEAVTDPVTGETTYQTIEAFQNVVDEERQARLSEREASRKPIVTPAQRLENRARVMSSIQQLPENQRAAAYAQLMANPGSFGGIDTEGMPQAYDPSYAAAVAGTGITQQQMMALRLREAELERKRQADAVRASQGERRLTNQAVRSAPSHPKPPSGFILD